MASCSRQGLKMGLADNKNKKMKKGPRQPKGIADEAPLPSRSAESADCKTVRGKPNSSTHKMEPPAVEDIRRSSRRHNGKSALELLGISPRKPRGPNLKATKSSEPVKGTHKVGTKVPAVISSKKVQEGNGQSSSPSVKDNVTVGGGVEISGTKRITRKVLEVLACTESNASSVDAALKVLRKTTPSNMSTQKKIGVKQLPKVMQSTLATESVSESLGTAAKDAMNRSPQPTNEPNVTAITKAALPTNVPKTGKTFSSMQLEADGEEVSASDSYDSSYVSRLTKKRKASMSEDELSSKSQRKDCAEEVTSGITDGYQVTTTTDGSPAEVIVKTTQMVEGVGLDTELALQETNSLEGKVIQLEVTDTNGLQIVSDSTPVEETVEEVQLIPEEKGTVMQTVLQVVSGEIEPSSKQAASVVEIPAIKAVGFKKRMTKKRIVKAIVITPSGEKKEIELEEGVSTVKALERILSGTSSGNQFDIAQLAVDVNKQIEDSMHSEPEPDQAITPVAHKPGTGHRQSQVCHLEAEQVVMVCDTDVIDLVTEADASADQGNQTGVEDISFVPQLVDAEHKMAYEALSQLANSSPGSQPITIELGDSTIVDIDWLQQQGLQVVVADGAEDRWHRQSLGMEDPAALAQLVNKMCTQRVRARPEKHLVASDDLQEMINRLEPDDNISNHIEWITHDGDGRKMHCKHCKFVLRDKHQFRKHMSVHKDQVEYKPWKCPICHYRAPVRAQIARHVNIHGELKPFVCKECGKGFNFKQKLLLHLKYHLDIRDRYCPCCDLAFHEHKTLKNHLKKIHHVDQLTPEMMAKVKTPRSAAQKQSAKSKVRTTTMVAGTSTTTSSATSPVDTTPVVETAAGTLPPVVTPSPLIPGEDNEIPLVEGEEVKSPEHETGLLEKLPVEQSDGAPTKKTSQLYGTRKTFLYTQQYKMGLLPAADRNNVPISEVHIAEPSEENAEGGRPCTAAEQKRRRLVIPKITSSHQLEPVLQQYCRVQKVDDSRGVSQTRFFCELCEIESFTSKTGFIHHLEQKHPHIRAWSCSECTYTCRMRSSLIVHMKLHTGIKDYPCEVCGKAFAFKQKLKNHMKHHMNLREHQCHLCDKAFNEKNDLTKHVKKVHNSERDCMCTVCEKAFKDQVQLRRHMDGHSNTRYLCEHCNKLYRSRVSLAQHMKCHTCMFHCEICDKNFGSYSGFMAHKVMHDESYEGYECELCKKVLHTKGSLTRHLAISHSNARPHACEECGKQFKTKKDLKNHHIVHETDRRFKCDVCEFTCKRPESLRVHQRRHSDVKPFQCGVCGKDYTQKHALETHLRHHTGKVEGSCPICGREFFTRYQLDTHIRRKHQVNLIPVTEEGAPGTAMVEVPGIVDSMAIKGSEKPMTVFMCEECNSVFMSQDSLAVHILAEHMKQGWLSSSPAEMSASGALPAASESLLADGVLTMSVSETIEESPIGNTVDLIAETEGMVAAAAAVDLPSEGSFDGQPTIETLVSITDPGSTKQRLVSLIHPIDSVPAELEVEVEEGGGSMSVIEHVSQAVVEPKETATQKLNALYEQHPETYVAITDPNSNQEMLVAIPHSNFESLLAATEAGVEADGTFITHVREDYITVGPPGSGEAFVTMASDIVEPAQAMIAMSSSGVELGASESCEAVAETIEIPIESECVTVLDDPQ